MVSKGRSVVNSNVFMCCCMVEKGKYRKYQCFVCVFAWPKGGHVEKCRVFVCVLHGRREDMLKSVVFLCVFA